MNRIEFAFVSEFEIEFEMLYDWQKNRGGNPICGFVSPPFLANIYTCLLYYNNERRGTLNEQQIRSIHKNLLLRLLSLLFTGKTSGTS